MHELMALGGLTGAHANLKRPIGKANKKIINSAPCFPHRLIIRYYTFPYETKLVGFTYLQIITIIQKKNRK